MHVVAVIYSYTYQIFRGSLKALRQLKIPINFGSLLDYEEAFNYISEMVRVDSFDSQHYVDGAKGMDTVYLLVSLCRSGVAYVARALAFLSVFGIDNAIEFYKSAGKLKYKELALDAEVFGEDVVPYVKRGIAAQREEKRSAAEQAREMREKNGGVDAAVEEEYMKMEV